MSTAWLEGNRSFFLGAQAFLLDNDREVASNWAAKHIVHNPAHHYVLGRFVEADRANSNRQLFSLNGLQMGRPTITHAPMNMNHASRRVVGTYVAAELVYPTGDIASAGISSLPECPACSTAMRLTKANAWCPKCEPDTEANYVAELQATMERAGLQLNPFIEALGVFWKHYFPDEFSLVQTAHAEGRLFYSMECIPAEIQCTGNGGCGATYEYAGRTSTTYCDHLNQTTSDKLLIQPHFTGGAILVPPTRPGWSHADIHSLVAEHVDLAEKIYENVKDELPHLSPSDWEGVMQQLVVLAK